MHGIKVSLGMAVATLLVVSQASAQAGPKKEFGVDLAIASTGFDGGDGRVLQVGTPVDVRIGFLTNSPVGLETRFGFLYTSDENSSSMWLSPSLHGLFQFASGSGSNRHLAPYFAAGVHMDMQRESFEILGETETDSRTQLGVSVGVGTRIGWGSAAFRPELFFMKGFEKGDATDDDFVPASTTFGLRLGISFFN